ncbi:MAG: tetratricopeptide repeat protein [Blastochloris sp.]|nr:tetratricopeptide repeat protein [Blastochloris sp.]
MLTLASVSIRRGHYGQAQDMIGQARLLAARQKARTAEARISNIDGTLCLHRQDLNGAVERYNRAYDLIQETQDPLLKIITLNNVGLSRWLVGQPQEAANFFRKALDQFDQIERPTMKTATLTNLGFILYEGLGRREEGLSLIEQALSLMEDKGVLIDEGGCTPELLRVVLQSLRDQMMASPEIPRPIEELIGQLLKTTSWELAERMVQTNRQDLLQPDLTRALKLEADEARKQQQLEVAEVLHAYQRTLELCREVSIVSAFQRAREQFDSAALYAWWGRVHRACREYVPALIKLNRALELAPESAEYYIERGWIQRGIGQYQRAQADFDQAIALGNTQGRSHLGRGVIAFELGHYEEALSQLSVAIDDNPNSAYAYHWRAAVYQKIEKLSLALSDIERARTIDMTNPDHEYWQAIIKIDAADLHGAKAHLDLLIEQDRGIGMALIYDLVWRGVCQTLMGAQVAASSDFAEAQSVLREFADSTEKRYAAALLAAARGQFSEAEAAYVQAIGRSGRNHQYVSFRNHMHLLARLFPQHATQLLLLN